MVTTRIKTLGKILAVSALLAVIGFCSIAPSVAATGDGRRTFGYKRDTTYEEYISQYKDAPKGQSEIIIPAADYVDTDMDIEVLENFEGSVGKSIKTSENGYVEWEFEVPADGLYNISMKYFPITGKNSPIERELAIDGKVLFGEAKNLSFKRVWKDSAYEKDNRGNELSPIQVESPMWMEVPFKDAYGYYNDPFEFYFTKGKHRIRLTSVKEPAVIEYIRLYVEEELPTYEEIKKTYEQNGYKSPKDQFIKIQAEKTLYKSSQTDLPWNDRSSPAIEPSHPSQIRMNVIGSTGYQSMPGEWIAWEIDVPEDGLYKIALKVKQSFVTGGFTSRKLYIDGKIPFKEAGNIRFNYSPDFQMKVLGEDETGEPYLFYLTKGKHIIKLESTIGDLADLLKQAEESVYYLNEAYRRIIMRTSATPDIYRDYDLDKTVPEAIETFRQQAQIVKGMAEHLYNETKTKGDNYAVLHRLAIQLEDLARKPHTIPSRLDNLNGNISALGSIIYDLRMQPVEIDYFIVASEDAVMPKPEAGFFQQLVYEVQRFIASFVTDYNTVGNVMEEDEDIVEVWVNAGRIQAEIIKRLADSTFTAKTGINVNIKLVNASLLQAYVAGEAPDVALTYGQAEPINYATRNAMYDLTKFPDFDEVAKRFMPSALVPFRLINNDGSYSYFALPERQSFPMLFYRVDVLQDLGLEVPNTWDDVYNMLSVLHKNHMNFVVPYTDVSGNTGSYGIGGITISAGAGGSGGSGLTTFGMLLFQNGGQYYTDDTTACALDSENAIQSFKRWIEMYVNYHLPQRVDFANRFRTGEMPIGIADYIGTYNTLSVFAPELRGLWKIAPVPGTLQPDGTIRRDVPGNSTACMILKSAKNPEKAWEFLKWWTSEETQYQFAINMESTIGASARQPMSNVAVHERLPWTREEYENIMEQWKWVRGVPEVPGGYYLTRHVDNAFRKIINEGEDVREAVLDYTEIINDEIDKKRKEFGLKLRSETNQ